MPQLLVGKFHYFLMLTPCVLFKTLAYEIFPNTLLVDTLLLLTCWYVIGASDFYIIV